MLECSGAGIMNIPRSSIQYQRKSVNALKVRLRGNHFKKSLQLKYNNQKTEETYSDYMWLTLRVAKLCYSIIFPKIQF